MKKVCCIFIHDKPKEGKFSRQEVIDCFKDTLKDNDIVKCFHFLKNKDDLSGDEMIEELKWLHKTIGDSLDKVGVK